MKLIIILIFIQYVLIGQLLPTIPGNIFRLSLGTSVANDKWEINDNQFSFNGIGRRYFDKDTYNDSVRFSSNYDLYNNGSAYIDSVTTIQQWMSDFNQSYGYSLPIFEAQGIDTSKVMESDGGFSENRYRTVNSKYLHLDYGMSNEITLSLSIPIIDSYVIEQSFSNVYTNKIEGAQILVDYHLSTRQELKTFIESNNYSNLRRGLKDTLQNIYDLFYTNNGQFSTKWAFHSQDDPIGNLLIDPGFLPPGIDKDSVSLSDLVTYYYPSKKNGNGIGDIKVGATILLSGTPTWALDGSGNAIYGQFSVLIPYGKTLTQFLDIRRKQFSEAKIGSGSTRWAIGFYGSKMINSKKLRRIYIQTQMEFSTMTTLNTPVELFSGGHSHPDSILGLIGNTYKYDRGTSVSINLGSELEQIENRVRIQGELFATFKAKDNYLSKNKYWDNWMEKYSGNSPHYNKIDLKLEILILNSVSKNKIGPIPFDIFTGFRKTLTSENTYAGWSAYAGITTYHQGW